eukprot:CAMPEP_0203657404 /NCGR_PEP_ID=MMETSP0088-20131115/44742_1 /ASSEMBLY_ACC=CAM_ASM_001087 /TAXON_ID=426623 /ORGANISM="Chaetoceros affinis, Strain CCMP159" /LENGTH=44 /DNA_ID= /DNA_START= /DNA_END= /DNA_ORIENTATION=
MEKLSPLNPLSGGPAPALAALVEPPPQAQQASLAVKPWLAKRCP